MVASIPDLPVEKKRRTLNRTSTIAPARFVKLAKRLRSPQKFADLKVVSKCPIFAARLLNHKRMNDDAAPPVLLSTPLVLLSTPLVLLSTPLVLLSTPRPPPWGPPHKR
ncbi:MAG: hypothetical protein CBE43_07970 [Rhodopirellula sp. TMED283]|nr:MAG: hypothetical protein CBE43_07970 [Rhodopirellula sp. TMED283]